MCFEHGLFLDAIPRADALRGLAALSALPLLPSMAERSPLHARPLNEGRTWTAIEHTTALTGDDLTPLADATILLKDDRIVAVGQAQHVTVPASAYRIDARHTYTIPGLCDGHIHFFQSGGLYTRPDVIDLRAVRPYTDELAWIKRNLHDTFARYLRAGITSVVDVGGPFFNYDVRAEAQRTEVAPRVLVAGPLLSSVEREILNPLGDPPIVKIDTLEAATALIDRQLARQTDFVKFWWVVLPDHPANAFEPLARAAIEYAHGKGARVVIHAIELETARLAVESGADILAHSVFDTDVDDAFLELLRARKVIYTPTLIVLGNYGYTLHERPNLSQHDLRFANPEIVGTLFGLQDVEQTLPPQLLAAVRSRRIPEPPHAAMRNLKRVQDAGIRIAAGTDAGNIGTQHASSLYDEFVAMVESGLSPRDVLKTATLGGAALVNRSADLGTIAQGKLADLVILNADPLVDIRAVAAVRQVVKDGHVYSPHAILQESAADIVQRQVNAYNFHDAQVFGETYAAGARVRRDGKTIATSRQEISAIYAKRFAQNPGLHVEIISREFHGSTIVDREHVTGLGEQPLDATITYVVKDGLIAEAEIVTVS